jgi:hypothetical protein
LQVSSLPSVCCKKLFSQTHASAALASRAAFYQLSSVS